MEWGVARQEIRQLQEIIKLADAKAFVIISEVQDVYGEGFKEE